MARPRRAVRNQRAADDARSPKQVKPAGSDSPPMSDSPQKACIQCQDYKSLNDFPRNRNRQDGRDNRCKRCTARVVAARVARRAPVLTAQVSHKVCVRCGKEKAAAAFNRNKVRPDGLCSYCKVCNAAAAAERRKTRQPVLEPTVAHKVCSECGEDQPAAAFHRSKSYNDGLYGKCKRCCAAALQRRRAAAEGGAVAPVPHGSGRRGGRHQHHGGEPAFGGLGSADISSMLSDASRYGDPITKAMAELVAENARSGNPARTPQELSVALLQGGTPREAVETRLPGLVSTLFARSGGCAGATDSAGDSGSDEEGDSYDSAHTASRDGRSGRSGVSGLLPRHTRVADTVGARPALGLTAADLGAGAFGSPQSLPGDPSGTASAATRTSLRNSSSLNTGAGSGRPLSAAIAPRAEAGEEDDGRPSPQRRTRQSIRTTSRLNAAYAIEMMRAEGAKDMRHIMDALVEPPEAQQPQQPEQPGSPGGRGRRSLRPRRAPAHYRDNSPDSPPEGSQGTDRSGQHRSGRGGEGGGGVAAAGDWGMPGPGSTTSGSPASAQTPLYANAPSAGLLAKLQAARAMSRQRMLENLAAQGLPPPPEPLRPELQMQQQMQQQMHQLGAASGFNKGPGGSTPYQTALELMGLAPNPQHLQQPMPQPGTVGSQMSGGSSLGGGGGNNAAFFDAALGAGSPTGFGSQMSGGSLGSGGSGGKRPRDIDPSALAAMDVGLPSPKRHAHLRQILESSDGNPWAAAAAAHPSAPSAANSMAVRRAATTSGMLMPPPELPAGFGRGGNLAGAPLQNFRLSGAMADPAAAAAAAAVAWGGISQPGSAISQQGGRSLIDAYLPATTSAAINAYAAQLRSAEPFSPPRSSTGAAVPVSPFGGAQAAGSPAGGYNAAAFAAEMASLAATNPAAVAAATSVLLDPNCTTSADVLRRASGLSAGLSTPRGSRIPGPSPALSPSEAAAARWADFILGSSAAARQAHSRSHSPPSPQHAAPALAAGLLSPSPLRPTPTRAAGGAATPPLPGSLPGTPSGSGRGGARQLLASAGFLGGALGGDYGGVSAAQLQAHQAAQLQLLLGNGAAAAAETPTLQQQPQQQAPAPTLQQHLHQQLEAELQQLQAQIQQQAPPQQQQQQQPVAEAKPEPQQDASLLDQQLDQELLQLQAAHSGQPQQQEQLQAESQQPNHQPQQPPAEQPQVPEMQQPPAEQPQVPETQQQQPAEASKAGQAAAPGAPHVAAAQQQPASGAVEALTPEQAAPEETQALPPLPEAGQQPWEAQ